jgi:5-methylcytosine-specific restriction enzyme A
MEVFVLLFENKWLKEIIPALTALGGKATLEDIYKQVEATSLIDLESFTDWRSQIRKNIYLHSSDTDIFKYPPGSEYDIFYSIEGRGKGKWGFREKNFNPPTDTYVSNEFFEIGKEYKRTDMHDYFGGNRQRGISYPKNHPMIFIFTSKSGKEYGYRDEWQDQYTFHYSGEGQIGDQTFKEGNKILRDQMQSCRRIYLFESSKRNSYYSFINEFNCTGYHFRDGYDKLGNLRKVIVFELIRIN